VTNVRFILCTILAGSLLITGCSQRIPDATVMLVDTSLSITPRAEKAALDAVQTQIAHMQRGDQLVLIPITGNAANDAGGRVLRLTAPTRRETYDTDLRRFQEQALKRFAAWKAPLNERQFQTDILGALDTARQELVSLPKESNHRLAVVSDFIEDDGTYRFVSADSLANPARARRLAVRLREQHGFTLQGVPLCLGRLESSDFAPLSAQRKDTVQAFWTAYFAAGGDPIAIRYDGTGMLADAEHGCFGQR
jgi:hypothetical protein